MAAALKLPTGDWLLLRFSLSYGVKSSIEGTGRCSCFSCVGFDMAVPKLHEQTFRVWGFRLILPQALSCSTKLLLAATGQGPRALPKALTETLTLLRHRYRVMNNL